MFEEVWRWSGQFRRSEKNIGVSWYIGLYTFIRSPMATDVTLA
jgi:fido (protein-threonine AMPylation protein)